jgi:hypothetical protein
MGIGSPKDNGCNSNKQELQGGKLLLSSPSWYEILPQSTSLTLGFPLK